MQLQSSRTLPVLQDFGDMIRRHREMDADITLCSCSVSREHAGKRGLVRVDPHTGKAPALTASTHNTWLRRFCNLSVSGISDLYS